MGIIDIHKIECVHSLCEHLRLYYVRKKIKGKKHTIITVSLPLKTWPGTISQPDRQIVAGNVLLAENRTLFAMLSSKFPQGKTAAPHDWHITVPIPLHHVPPHSFHAAGMDNWIERASPPSIPWTTDADLGWTLVSTTVPLAATSELARSIHRSAPLHVRPIL